MDEQDHDGLTKDSSRPAKESLAEREERVRRFMEGLDALAAEVGAVWPSGLTAVEAVRAQRRDLVPSEWVTWKNE